MTVSDALMMSAADVAKRDGVSKQAVSKKVRTFADKHGLEVQRGPRNAIVAFNVAQYDVLRERLDDPSKAQRSPPPEADPPPPARRESYDEALRQKTVIETERSRLRLAEEKGELIRVATLADAIADCGAEISKIIDQLPGAADDLAAALGRDGVHGLRVTLKSIAQKVRVDVAAALAAIASNEPETERTEEEGAFAFGPADS